MYFHQIFVFFLIFTTKFWETNACKGCINLDESSFNKIRNKFEVILVKFDVAFPYGDKHEVFTKFAEEVQNNPDILLGEVGVKDYGEKDNEAFARSYNVQKEDFPGLKLFKKGVEGPVTFPADRTFDLGNLRDFVRDNTRIYLGLPGCVEDYDKLAEEFVQSEDKTKILERAAKLEDGMLEGPDKSSAKIYLVLMRKIIDNGVDFIAQEKERVNKLLKGKISSKKQVELNSRLNILRAFNSAPLRDEL